MALTRASRTIAAARNRLGACSLESRRRNLSSGPLRRAGPAASSLWAEVAAVRDASAPGYAALRRGDRRPAGVSRTPVREALLQLATHGVVRFERSRGVRILQIDTRDIEEIYTLRYLLEVPSAYRAATMMTDDQMASFSKALERMRQACESGDERLFQEEDVAFHEMILEAAGNTRVTQSVAMMRAQLAARGLSTTKTRTLWDIWRVHERILERIQDRDEQGAAQAMRDHLLGTTRLLLTQSTGDPEAGARYAPPVLPVFTDD
ncbi:GntR family transcriptional regulator [Nonomuraea harbinensis]|uniref:GntR family transcriptional regulator n=1 Tax=Nonomuraea harbinensis TaxID=1286938 RepID=A0ABW1C931_9ACTN|nr:GntR family transcriptional regulator [Nonomuraea harbinensis]